MNSIESISLLNSSGLAVIHLRQARKEMDASSQHQKSMANGFGFNSLLLLSSPFIHTPFPPQLFTQSSHSKPNLHLTVNLVRHLRSSIVSTAENCLRFLDSFASPNPVLDKLFIFFSSHFHDFCQIRRRNYRNLNFMANHNFAAIIPGDSVAGIVATNGILNFLNIYNTILVVRLVLTWFPNSPPAIVSPLSTLCDPYLNIFRGIIPPLGGLDLSPILAFLVLNAFTSAAAALPAELPSTGISQDIRLSNTAVSHLTTSEKKWMRRLFGSRSKSSTSDI